MYPITSCGNVGLRTRYRMLTGFLLRSHLEVPRPHWSSSAHVALVGITFLEILLMTGQFFQEPDRPDEPPTKPRFPYVSTRIHQNSLESFSMAL
jgi:hypothetical protein